MYPENVTGEDAKCEGPDIRSGAYDTDEECPPAYLGTHSSVIASRETTFPRRGNSTAPGCPANCLATGAFYSGLQKARGKVLGMTMPASEARHWRETKNKTTLPLSRDT